MVALQTSQREDSKLRSFSGEMDGYFMIVPYANIALSAFSYFGNFNIIIATAFFQKLHTRLHILFAVIAVLNIVSKGIYFFVIFQIFISSLKQTVKRKVK